VKQCTRTYGGSCYRGLIWNRRITWHVASQFDAGQNSHTIVLYVCVYIAFDFISFSNFWKAGTKDMFVYVPRVFTLWLNKLCLSPITISQLPCPYLIKLPFFTPASNCWSHILIPSPQKIYHSSYDVLFHLGMWSVQGVITDADIPSKFAEKMQQSASSVNCIVFFSNTYIYILYLSCFGE